MYVTEQTSPEATVHKLAPAAPAVQEVALVDVSNLLVQHDKGFSLRIPQLQMFPADMLAVLGANGSGKSTLLSCLFGGGVSFAGSVQLLGQQPGQLPLAQRHRLGVQWLGAGFNELYRVREIQELYRRCYGRSDASVFEAFGVPELGKRRFGRLSSGEQQRVQLAPSPCGVHDPDHLPEVQLRLLSGRWVGQKHRRGALLPSQLLASEPS